VKTNKEDSDKTIDTYISMLREPTFVVELALVIFHLRFSFYSLYFGFNTSSIMTILNTNLPNK
jgi:hypothetical protein